MNATTKDFGPIRDDYAFFENHSTEADADIQAYMPHVQALMAKKPSIHMLDFGCGDGNFSAKFHASAQIPAERLRLSLVEPETVYRQTAIARLQPLTIHPIQAWPERPSAFETTFDLILANHVLYYVPDLDSTVLALTRALAPGGLFLLAMGGQRNVLMNFAEHGFGLIGIDVPYHTAEELQIVLAQQKIRYTVEDVYYELCFPDSAKNRLSVLRFLLGEHFQKIPRKVILDLFNPYAADGQIGVPIMHEHFIIQGHEVPEWNR